MLNRLVRPRVAVMAVVVSLGPVVAALAQHPLHALVGPPLQDQVTTVDRQTWNADVVFHGNRRSKVYHAPTCRNYHCPNCVVVFKSHDEAQAAGYRPARDCIR